MGNIYSDTLSNWRKEGRESILKNSEIFYSLVAQAKDLMERGKYEAAVIIAYKAAYHAMGEHCGIYASSELEMILLTIGREAIHEDLFSRNASLAKTPKKVLHVVTAISDYLGGLSRLVKRWIERDKEHSHSLCLTNQNPLSLSKEIKDVVINSEGQVYILNVGNSGLISRAKQLHKLATTFDIIVDHGWEFDPVSTIAFATKENLPPVIHVNHGDHWFWLGASVCDVVVNLRESGMRLSNKRRGIEIERNLLLPTPLEPVHRVFSRAEAKEKLGIDKNGIMLLSIARAPKYRKFDGIDFASAHLPLLKQHEQVILIIIGPADSEDWSSPIQQTQGRIRVLGPTEQTAIFYQAADIYVDSFPFVSITSLLEAGSYGLPLVSRYPYSSDSCDIFGADMAGLNGNLIRAKNLLEYTKVLSHLIEDEDYRLLLGEATREKIESSHWGENWQNTLENIYTQATILPRIVRSLSSTDQIHTDEPDVFSPSLYGGHYTSEWFDGFLMENMPLNERWINWIILSKKYEYSFPLKFLIPKWLYRIMLSFKLKYL
jgi:Glycosyl transferases group 1